MTRQLTDFSRRYGPWGLVAGASEGLGAAFAEAMAQRGLSVLLLARRASKLREVAAHLEATYGVSTHTFALDLADGESAIASLQAEIESAGIDLGLLVYNAAYAPVGHFLERETKDLLGVLDVNVRGLILLVHKLAPVLVERGRGGIVVMSSLAGLQGTPKLATYAASKAFGTVLAESLWGELREHGVDVISSCAGAIRTPGYASAENSDEAPGTMDASDIAETTLNALGRGPRVVPGLLNKIAQWLVGRWLPRSIAIKIMKQNTETLS